MIQMDQNLIEMQFSRGGTELVDDGDLILTPSGSVKNQNYDSFYDMYRYRFQ